MNILKRLRTIASLGTLMILVIGYQNCSAPFAISKEFGANSAASSLPGTVVPPAKVGKARVFVAAGHVGRTLMSCDGGLTWINDQSANDAARCWTTGDPNYLECDHQPTAGHGVSISDGQIYVNNGWGFNGSLRRSKNGSNWATMRTDGWGPGVEAFGSQLVLMWNGMQTSNDAGATWSSVVNPPSLGHPAVRKVGEQLFIFGEGGPAALSNDHGVTWQTPTGLGTFSVHDVTSSGSRLVAVGDTNDPTKGSAAVSTDGGLTWTSLQIGNPEWYGGWHSIIFDGTNFVSWSNGYRFTSADGVKWATQLISFTAGGSFTGLVSYDPALKVYVSILDGWGTWYGSQHAYRSTDGAVWTELSTSAFKGGHPISRIIAGEVDANACP